MAADRDAMAADRGAMLAAGDPQAKLAGTVARWRLTGGAMTAVMAVRPWPIWSLHVDSLRVDRRR